MVRTFKSTCVIRTSIMCSGTRYDESICLLLIGVESLEPLKEWAWSCFSGIIFGIHHLFVLQPVALVCCFVYTMKVEKINYHTVFLSSDDWSELE